LSSGGEVSLTNTNGNVKITTWDRDKVDVFAEIEVRYGNRRRAEEYLDEVKIIFDHDDDFLNVEVEYPGKGNRGFLSWMFGDRKPSVSVRFEVKVPEKINLDIGNVNGNIDITGASGKIKTRTTNGSIYLAEIKGETSCSSTNGSISVELEKVFDFDEMSFKTTNGKIKLTVPSHIEANVEASTVNGGIDTELPLEVHGRFNRKSIRGKVNGGGGDILLKTVNGGITIRSYR
jgi:DUF4097 and DUF4098 domain-containing protein YvlB